MFLFEQSHYSMIQKVHFNFHNMPDINICTRLLMCRWTTGLVYQSWEESVLCTKMLALLCKDELQTQTNNCRKYLWC